MLHNKSLNNSVVLLRNVKQQHDFLQYTLLPAAHKTYVNWLHANHVCRTVLVLESVRFTVPNFMSIGPAISEIWWLSAILDLTNMAILCIHPTGSGAVMRSDSCVSFGAMRYKLLFVSVFT